MVDDERRIFIGGLKFSTENDTLAHYFSQWGQLEEVKIVRYPPPDSRSKGFGFVTFGTQAARDSCVALGHHEIDGKTIEIRLADSGHKEKQRAMVGERTEELVKVDLEDVKFRRLFVGNIDHNWDDDIIKEYFCNIGSVQECTVKKNKEGKPLGFAFMTFATSACVDKIQQLRPHTIQGRRVETKRQVAKQYVGTPEAKLEVDRIWIGAAEAQKGGKEHFGLGEQHSDQILQTYFSNYGSVVKVQQLMWEDTKKKRGYGFIVFDDFDAVDKVVLSQVHVIEGTRIQAKKAVKDREKMSGGGRNNVGGGGMTNMNSGGVGMMNNMNSGSGMMNNMNNMSRMNNMDMNNMNNMNINNMNTMGNMNNMSSMNSINMMGGGGMGSSSGSMERNGRKRGMESQMMPKKKIRMEARDPESELMRSIFVGNLNPLSTKADLDEYFAKFGTVLQINLKTQPGSERNKGFAFVIFSKSEEVDNVMAGKPHRLTGTNIDCKRKTPKSDAPMMEERVKKIWIGRPELEYGIKSFGLNDTTTDEVLTNYFSRFGVVTHIHQFTWKDTQKKRGYGYITFEDEDSVDKVVLLGIHSVEGVQLQAKKAMTKESQESVDRKKMAMEQQNTGNYNSMGGGRGGDRGMGGGMNIDMSGGMGSMGTGIGNMGVGMSNMGAGMNNMGAMNTMGVVGMNNMGGGAMNAMGSAGMGNMGAGMNNMAAAGMNTMGAMGVGGMGMNNMAAGGGMNNMGAVGMTNMGMNNMGTGMMTPNTMMSNNMAGGMVGGLANMAAPPPSLPNRANNAAGNKMMSNKPSSADSFSSMSNNMQSMMNQMNSNSGQGEMTGNMKAMMNNMNSMMGSIQADKKDDSQDKMMGMMSNMMSMMNNMASMMQTNTRKEEAPPPATAPIPTTAYSSGSSYTSPAPGSRGGQSGGYGGSSGRNNSGGSSYPSQTPASGYGYGYGN